MIIDWSKYKRFFTFGCSFTSYMWPTWADIVSKEMPQTEFYNFGRSGAGNTLISYRIAEANNRYKFNDTDLIMVMFTTYLREDRWLDTEQSNQIEGAGDGWLCGGNVFNNRFYADDWVRKYASERGYLIRDAAVIDMTMRYLDNTNATSYCMLSAPFGLDSENINSNTYLPYDVRNVYKETFDRFPKSLYELELLPNSKILHADYKFSDGHPSPIRYYNYINKLGFNLTDKSKQYANEMSDILSSIEVRNIVPVYFPEQDKNIDKAHKLLF